MKNQASVFDSPSYHFPLQKGRFHAALVRFFSTFGQRAKSQNKVGERHNEIYFGRHTHTKLEEHACNFEKLLGSRKLLEEFDVTLRLKGRECAVTGDHQVGQHRALEVGR